ncbi:ninjurin-2-like [Clavelina lepadiformis]|uniref:Ninjurin-1 n=1 Tax=Clavelina lepadiformis TaxID=159417 RepID=A0ABP0FAD8_CLALP
MSEAVTEERVPVPDTQQSDTMPGPQGDTLKSYKVTTTKVIQGEPKFAYDRYATIKSVGLGLLIVALIVDAACRIRLVVDHGSDRKWYLPMLILLCILMGLQVVEAILLMCLGTQNVEYRDKQPSLTRTNIVSTIFAGLIAILNVIVLQIMGDAGVYPMYSVPNWNRTT